MITVAEIESLPLPELSEPSNIVEKIHIREVRNLIGRKLKRGE